MSEEKDFNKLEFNYKEELLNFFLDRVPFTGWCNYTYSESLSEIDHDGLYESIFPNGLKDLTQYYFDKADNDLLAQISKLDISSFSIREKIKTFILFRLQFYDLNRESVRSLIGSSIVNILDKNLLSTVKTVDIMWRSAGDKSTDYNFYSKRAILLGVYISTILYWINNNNKNEVANFIDRRMTQIMNFEKVKKKTKSLFFEKNNPFFILKNSLFRSR